MRKKIIAGNWKMNLTLSEAERLVTGLMAGAAGGTARVMLAPPFVYLPVFAERIRSQGWILAAQNCSEHPAGAFTGEISAQMLASIPVSHCLVGHSERRTLYGETDAVIAAKVRQLLAHNLSPVFCCGETLQEREAGQQEPVVGRQLEAGLFHLDAAAFSRCIVAYEPVWAIGTGRTASPEQAQDMHRFIRESAAKKYGPAAAGDLTLLYGGSVTAANATSLFRQEDVDGALVGGASLKAADFLDIIRQLQQLTPA
jgi:triosephosphate isomerase